MDLIRPNRHQDLKDEDGTGHGKTNQSYVTKKVKRIILITMAI